MKYKNNILAASVLSLLALGSAQATELRIGVAPDPYPPISWKSPSGKMKGYEIELLDSVCAAANVDCKLYEMSWDGLLPALEENKIDVVWSSLSISDSRKVKYLFTAPLYASRPVLVGLKGDTTNIEFCKAGSLDGKQYGTAAGSMLLGYSEKCFGPGLRVKSYPSQDAMTSDLALGRVDYVAGSRLGLDKFLATAEGKNFEIKATFPDDPSLGTLIGGALRKDDQQTKIILDGGLQKIRDNGEYQRLSQKFFDFDVTP